MKMYWVNTKKYCGAVSVDKYNKINFHNTAPCYRWAANKGMTFSKFKEYLMKKGYLLNIKKI